MSCKFLKVAVLFSCLLVLQAAIMIVPIYAQELVPDPGFEIIFKCPTGFNTNKSETRITPHWNSPSHGTPDLFNKCNKHQMGVSNVAGVTEPFAGDGFAGIILYESKKGYREYLQVRLLGALQKDMAYSVSVRYKLATYSKYAIDRIGVAFSDSAVQFRTDKEISLKPAYTKIKDEPMDVHTGGWEFLNYEYKAIGGERYLTIGNFSDNAATKAQYLSFVNTQEPMLANAAYYYIDEVSVLPVTTHEPLIFAGKELANDQPYVLTDLNFNFDSDSLIGTSHIELDALAAIMKEQSGLFLLVTGHTDAAGSEAYNQRLSEKRARAVVRYLIAKGVDEHRVKGAGMGKSMPLVGENDALDAARNRRVEVRFLDKDAWNAYK